MSYIGVERSCGFSFGLGIYSAFDRLAGNSSNCGNGETVGAADVHGSHDAESAVAQGFIETAESLCVEEFFCVGH